MVDASEPEVLKRVAGGPLDGLSFGVGRVEPALAHGLEQGAQGGQGVRRGHGRF